jgi:CBS domain containing-hemolysin-like protein
MSWWVVTLITIALIVASAFFVIVEFALLAARRHRLEAEAPSSASARAALRGVNELTVMLAFAQLGITACTFLLGAITKPAIDYALAPVLTSWGVPGVVSGIVAFMLWINRIANRLVAASGVEPVEKAAAGGQDVDTIRELVNRSRAAGTLSDEYSQPIGHALALTTVTVEEIVRTETSPTSVPRTATIAEVQRTSISTGHLRILLGEGPDCRVVHVRDTLLAAPESPALDVSRPAFALRPDTPAHEALAQMRRNREQFAIVVDGGSLLGVVTLQDLLGRVLPTDVQR